MIPFETTQSFKNDLLYLALDLFVPNVCFGLGSITMIFFSVIALEEAKMPGNLSGRSLSFTAICVGGLHPRR